MPNDFILTQIYDGVVFKLYIASNADLDKIVDWRESDVQAVKNKYFSLAELLYNAVSSEKKLEEGILEKSWPDGDLKNYYAWLAFEHIAWQIYNQLEEEWSSFFIAFIYK